MYSFSRDNFTDTWEVLEGTLQPYIHLLYLLLLSYGTWETECSSLLVVLKKSCIAYKHRNNKNKYQMDFDIDSAVHSANERKAAVKFRFCENWY